MRGGLPRRRSIKVDKMMRSLAGWSSACREESQAEPFTNGASRLFKPSATVRHHARLWEENG